ncbi:MAG: hypothetical protein ACRYF0_17625 [Janthinobacterium lividum]
MASNTPNKEGKLSSRAITKEVSARNTKELAKLKPQTCGFQYFTIGCSDGGEYMGSAYTCNDNDGSQLLSRKMDVYDQYCD